MQIIDIGTYLNAFFIHCESQEIKFKKFKMFDN